MFLKTVTKSNQIFDKGPSALATVSILPSFYWMLALVCKRCCYPKQTHGADHFLLQWEAELLCCQTVRPLVLLAPNVDIAELPTQCV